ncbi:MAG: carbonic anhydrase [Campylobacteraceae bacterium]|jgi:carbonic anhydrase|nr:carbonic anhydrase [Campylobacteraceae bacterium]
MDIDALISGFERFKENKFKKYQNKFSDLIQNGQHPRVLFIACSDSRVDPSLITDSKPGELFVIRNIGNMVAPFAPDNEYHATAAGIEYAVSVLNVSDIIVCGHSHCGAIDGVYDIPEGKELIHVRKWLELANEAKKYVNENSPDDLDFSRRIELTEKISVLFQLNHLLSYPEVKRRVDEGTLSLRGWYYRIESCELEYYDDEKKQFLPMEAKS